MILIPALLPPFRFHAHAVAFKGLPPDISRLAGHRPVRAAIGFAMGGRIVVFAGYVNRYLLCHTDLIAGTSIPGDEIIWTSVIRGRQ